MSAGCDLQAFAPLAPPRSSQGAYILGKRMNRLEIAAQSLSQAVGIAMDGHNSCSFVGFQEKNPDGFFIFVHRSPILSFFLGVILQSGNLSIDFQETLGVFEHSQILLLLFLRKASEVGTAAIADEAGAGNNIHNLALHADGPVQWHAEDFSFFIADDTDFLFKGIHRFDAAAYGSLQTGQRSVDLLHSGQLAGFQKYHSELVLLDGDAAGVEVYLFEADAVTEIESGFHFRAVDDLYNIGSRKRSAPGNLLDDPS